MEKLDAIPDMSPLRCHSSKFCIPCKIIFSVTSKINSEERSER